MITTIGYLISENKNNQEATPENLRAAAKVLEDKAKELEKPKLTLSQQAVLDYRDAAERDGRCTPIRKFSTDAVGKTTYHRVNVDGTLAKWDDGKDECEIVHKFVKYADYGFVTFCVYYDDCGDLEVCLMYP